MQGKPQPENFCNKLKITRYNSIMRKPTADALRANSKHSNKIYEGLQIAANSFRVKARTSGEAVTIIEITPGAYLSNKEFISFIFNY